MLLKIVLFISSHFYAFLSISGGPEARISPRCSIHVICKKEKIKRFFCEFLERWRKNEGICSRQQNATWVCRASRPATTHARLAAWTALQNYVLLFSQPCRQYSHTKHSGVSRQAHFRRQPETIFRQPSSFLQSKSQPSLSQQPPFRRQPASTHPPSIFSYRPHSLPSSNTQQQPAGFTCRLPIPSPLHFSFSFFPLFFLFFFSYFSEIILNTGSSSTGSSGL